MKIGRFQILAQQASGPDGSRFEALDESSGAPVSLYLLDNAQHRPERWKTLARRLQHVALARHPALLPLIHLSLEHDPPYVVSAVPGPPLAQLPQAELPWSEERVLAALRRLAGALETGHRLGLAHGQLSPMTVFGAAPEDLRLDFTDLHADLATVDSTAQELDAACRAPECQGGRPAEPASDLFALGVLCGWLRFGRPLPAGWAAKNAPSRSLEGQLQTLLSAEPTDRPPASSFASEVLLDGGDSQAGNRRTHQREAMEETRALPFLPTMATRDGVKPFPTRLGRFRLEELLGEGGLGRVFRGVDVADGAVAAVKILHEHLAARPTIVKRFHKEARLLAEINNPFIVNLLEHNQDAGIHFLALEFIEGPSLHQVLSDRAICKEGKLSETLALALVMDVARALLDAHRRGIIHRDIKPQNIMVLRDSDLFSRIHASGDGAATLPPPGGAKLCDFGLARHVVESDSLHLTQEGTAVGTPLYMSPEQAAGRVDITPAADVYSLGATLYHLLAGRPPFTGDTALALSLSHANEPPPPLKQFAPAASDGVCRLLERCLAKKPADRPADGAELLEEMERLVRGDPSGISLHPRLPAAERLREYTWTWELQASPEQLWPYVSNTERLNRAAGVPAVEFSIDPAAGGAKSGDGVKPLIERTGTFRKVGVTNTWKEHPFEWIEGRRLGVLREYSQGVFKWLASTTTLDRLPTGGTRLTHEVRIEPRNFLGKLACAVEVGFKGRRTMERIYRRIDDYLAGRLSEGRAADAFEKPAALGRAQRRRLQQLIDRLRHEVAPEVAQALSDFIENAPDQEVSRIRPLALAVHLGVDADALTSACLLGAREGLLTLLWDILCPLCRIPSGLVETLKSLKDHGHCDACQADFTLDFASSVELIFRAHPSVRSAETRTYCLGGPAHSPHVAAQVRLLPAEPFQIDLNLPEGAYRVRGPQLAHALDLIIDPRATLSRAPITVPDDFRPGRPREPLRLQAGRQRLTFINNHPADVVLRVERTARRGDALTAARASTLAVFRRLFPGEVLDAGKLVSVAAVGFLAVDLSPATALDHPENLYALLGEPKAFALLRAFFEAGEKVASEYGGAVVKTLGDGMLLAFDDRLAVVRAGMALFTGGLKDLAAAWPQAANLLLKARGVAHHGPALATTVNDRLDYFGTTLQQTLNLLRQGDSGILTLTNALASDPDAMALVRDRVPATGIRVDEAAGMGMVLRVRSGFPA